MRRNATLCDDPEDPGADLLAPAQERALAALLNGQTITDAAAAAGVTRSTLHRWLSDDDAFIAAFNRGKRELRQAAATRLETLADGALACVEKAVADGDARIALGVLKGLGLLSGEPPSIGSDDPKRLASDRRTKRAMDSMLDTIRAELAEHGEELQDESALTSYVPRSPSWRA